MNFKPTQEMIRAAESVFSAKALVLALNPVVNGYKCKILAEGKWLPRDEFEVCFKEEIKPILEPARAWLMSEENFAEYDRLCNLARFDAGLYVDDPGKCPLLVAENLERLAIRELFRAFESVNKFTYDQVLSSSGSMELLKRATSLMLQLTAPFVRSAEEILEPA